MHNGHSGNSSPLLLRTFMILGWGFSFWWLDDTNSSLRMPRNLRYFDRSSIKNTISPLKVLFLGKRLSIQLDRFFEYIVTIFLVEIKKIEHNLGEILFKLARSLLILFPQRSFTLESKNSLFFRYYAKDKREREIRVV